jgi:hypothetical protein
MPKKTPTREEVILTWQALDKESERHVGAVAVANKMGISQYGIAKLFPESLTQIKRKHGIRLSPQEDRKSNDDLLSKLDEVVSKQGRIPGWSLLRRETSIHESQWKKRLGGRRGCSQEDIYKKYKEWLQEKSPESPNLEIVQHFLQPAARASKNAVAETSPGLRRKRTPTYEKTQGAKTYGPLLHFRNLTHEPTLEEGVVFLFGMVSEELGFAEIEHVGKDFPDCEGKRRVGKGEFQKVRIEIELKSSNYDHPMDPDIVVVCWEHDKKDLPLEVIELKSRIRELPGFLAEGSKRPKGKQS